MKESLPEQFNIQKTIETQKDESQLIFERYKEEGRTSGDYWYSRVVENVAEKTLEELEKGMVEALKAEVPMLCSSTMERACNFSCKHCLYPEKEESSQEESRAVGIGLDKIIYKITDQMPTKETSPRNMVGEVRPENPSFLHAGRILREWHLDILKNIKERRPDIRVGLIDNGTYTKFLDKFKEKNIKLDWLDISVDGVEKFHNLQRGSNSAFDITMNGLRHAREITVPPEKGGKVTSLFTLSNLNYQDKNIEKTADMLLSGEKPLVDEFNITTMSATRESLNSIVISPHYREGDVEEFKEAWTQIKNVFNKYGRDESGKQKVYLRIYIHEDLEKLAYAVGPKKFMEAVKDRESEDDYVGVDVGKMTFKIDGVVVNYFPVSIWPPEEFIIDADGASRVAFSIGHTLKELQSGKDKKGGDIKGYTVDYLNNDSDFIKTYQKEVDQWMEFKGKDFLKKEIEMFERIKKLSEDEKF